jgi:hypothetical protein
VTSSADEGTTFLVRLPKNKEQAPPPPEQVKEEVSSDSAAR